MNDSVGYYKSQSKALRKSLKDACYLLALHGKTVRNGEEWYKLFLDQAYREAKKIRKNEASRRSDETR